MDKINPLAFGEIKRYLKWLFIISSFIIIPAIIIFCVSFLIQMLSNNNDPKVISEFQTDVPLILLAFYSGGLGSLLSYIFMRLFLHSESEEIVKRLARLLLGGGLGIGAFFLLRSSALVRIFYPHLLVDGSDQKLTYHSVMLLSLICGLAAEAIIRSIQRKINAGHTSAKDY